MCQKGVQLRNTHLCHLSGTRYVLQTIHELRACQRNGGLPPKANQYFQLAACSLLEPAALQCSLRALSLLGTSGMSDIRLSTYVEEYHVHDPRSPLRCGQSAQQGRVDIQRGNSFRTLRASRCNPSIRSRLVFTVGLVERMSPNQLEQLQCLCALFVLLPF